MFVGTKFADVQAADQPGTDKVLRRENGSHHEEEVSGPWEDPVRAKQHVLARNGGVCAETGSPTEDPGYSEVTTTKGHPVVGFFAFDEADTVGRGDAFAREHVWRFLPGASISETE